MIVKSIADGKLSNVVISDYVFDEVVTYIQKKIGSAESSQISQLMIDSPRIKILFMNENIFNATYHVFRSYRQLSFTDASIIVMMKNNNINYIFSFDKNFDGIHDISRIVDVLE